MTIRNGSVYATTVTVLLRGVTGNTVKDLDVDGIVWGIELRDSDSNRIAGNRLVSAVLSLSTGSEGNVVRDNVLRGREGVISVHGASENRIVKNIVWTGVSTPIGVSDSHRNVIRENTLVTTHGLVMGISDSDDNTIAHNTLVQYGDYRDPAVRMQSSSRNVFRANELVGPPAGVVLLSGADNVFAANDLDGDVVPTFDYDRGGRLPGARRRQRGRCCGTTRSPASRTTASTSRFLAP